MITRQRTHWFRMLFIWHGSVLKKIVPQLTIIAVFSPMILYFSGTIYDYKVHLNPAIFTLIGLALAIFMGFCNTASYDCWWEGRKLWGALVIESRSLARQILTLVKDTSPWDGENKAGLIRMIAAFTPLPFAYSVLLHRTVYFYCFWLPFGLVDSPRWMMPLIDCAADQLYIYCPRCYCAGDLPAIPPPVTRLQ